VSAENKFITRWSRDFQGNLQEDPNGSWVLAADAALRDKRMMDKIDALQQRLTAADERNDEAIDLLRRARAVIAGGGWTDLEGDIAKFLNNKSALKPAETVAGHHPACRAVDDYKPGECSHGCKPATQPQGEPVAVKLPARDESLGTAENDMYANGWRHGWNAYEHAMRQLGPLYAEQPAPVAVVLAEAREWLGDGKHSDGLTREHWTPEYAALIDRIDATLRK
jgi:hypothetical protein